MLLFKAVLAGLAALSSAVSATELIPNLGERIAHELETRQTNILAVTGVRTNAGVHPRLELGDLMRNWDQANLYLLGLQRMQNMPQNHPLSYFQIAAIHGRPYVAWNGVGPLAGNENTGYCTHASNIFTTWHRPYLGLFEQSLYANVLEVVNQFQGTQRERYARAAATLRMPYLDVARNGRPTALPDIVSRARIWCDTPAGRREIPNPLYSYRFNPLGQLGARQAPFTVYPATLRHPSSTAPDAVSRNEIARQRLDNARISLRDRIHVLFRTYTNFNQFGNSAWYPDNSGRYDSVESVHDVVHGMVGGGGHMGFVDYSAMDPFFWLHHTNIDRLLAMFQVLNPNSYVQPQAQRSRTFTTRAGAVLDVNSALTPFRSNINGGFWTSASVRQTTVLGYNYVETASNANRDTVTAAINSLYGRTTTARRRRRDLSATPTATSTAATNGTLPNTNGTMPLTNGTLAENEYFANIASLKHGVGGTYSIYVFLSEPSKNPSEWPVQKSLVGTHVVFAPTADSASAMADIKTSGTVPLDSCLYDEVERGRLASLEEKDVLPFLHRELQYRCSLADDTEIPCEDVPELEFTVATAVVTPSRSETEFPRQGPIVEHKELTVGKPGGPTLGGPSCYCP